MTALLEVRNLSVAYGAIEAVRDISFTVEAGQIARLAHEENAALVDHVAVAGKGYAQIDAVGSVGQTGRKAHCQQRRILRIGIRRGDDLAHCVRYGDLAEFGFEGFAEPHLYTQRSTFEGGAVLGDCTNNVAVRP